MRSLLARWTVLPLLAVPGSTWALGLGEIELQSSFTQPLRAQIELLSATPEVLDTLNVGLAPVASFERFAVDRPAFLASLQFTVGRDDAARSVVLVTSTAPITELFVTMLVEAKWSGGTSLREYTMLLDPPARPGQTQAPAATRAAPMRSPQPDAVGEEIDRPVTTSASQPSAPAISDDAQVAATAQSVTPQAPRPSGDALTHGPVQRAETLWDIATQYRPAGVTMNQMMVAIYEANPQAFGKNMNVLRIGVVLRIPDLVALRGMAANTATVEVDRQTAERQGRPPQQASSTVSSSSPISSPTEDGRAGEVSRAQSTANDTQLAALQDRIGVLQSDLEEVRSLLATRDQELRDLRAEVAASREAEAATSREPETVMLPPAAAPEVLEIVPEEPSAVSLAFRLISAVSVAVGVGALLWAALWFRRRRGVEAIADSMDRWEPLEREIESGNTRDDDTARLPINVPDDFIVHEQPVEKTGRDKHGELLLVDEDADSLAEVDFHIAYGSHDRAAARLTKALENAPDNRELKLRLMEVYFQWGNQKAFLEAAEELRAALGEQTNSDWDKVVIMGRQICPDERLFAEATPCAGAVDLDLQTQNSPALDLAFSEQDGTEVGVDTGGVDDTRAEPETIDDDAATVRWEAADGVAIRSKAIGDREKTAALPATSPELDVGADGIVDVGELPDPRESPTVTQERHELDMSATLDEEADASSTTVMRETPDPVATAELDANITSEMLPAGDMIDRRADDQEQPALVDDLVTQLDLARAYMSIGQPEQALPMLEGALQKADGKSKKARHMLEEALQEAEAAVEKTKRLA